MEVGFVGCVGTKIMKKIEFTHKVKFIVPEDVEYGVVLGAVISSEK